MQYAYLKRILAIISLGVLTNIAPLTTGAPSFATTYNDEKVDIRSFSGAYLAGRIASSNNRIDLSLDFYKQALIYAPNNRVMQYDMFLASLSIGDFKQAFIMANTLKNNTSDERYVPLTLASEAFLKHNYLLAINRLESTHSNDLDSLIKEIMKSWANIGRGKNKEAIQAVKKIRGPQWYNLFLSYNLALLNDVANNKKEADIYYRQALKNQQGGASAPDTYERIIINYAAFELKNNKRENAVKILKSGESMLTGRSILKNIRQKVENGGEITSAIKTPQDGVSELFYDIGTAINQEGSESYARIFLQLSRALRKDNDDTIFQLANITARAQQYNEAIKLFSEIKPQSPFWRDSNLRLALTLDDSGENEKAIAKLTNLQKEFPNERNIALSLAGLYMQSKDYTKAADVIDTIIKQSNVSDNNNWIIYYQRGVAYERLKQWDKAALDFEKSLALNPKQPQVLNYFGYSLIDRNEKLDEALNMVRQAVALSPADGFIVDSLGWAYYKLGRYDDALTTLEDAIKLRPEDMTINEHLGDVYWQVGRKLQASFQWNHALVSASEPEDKIRIEDKIKNGLKSTTDTKNVQNIP